MRLHGEQWRIIPTNLGLRHPSKAWRLNEAMQRTHFARDKFIAYVESPYDQAVNILKAVGVLLSRGCPCFENCSGTARCR